MRCAWATPKRWLLSPSPALRSPSPSLYASLFVFHLLTHLQGSQDKTIKLWDLSKLDSDGESAEVQASAKLTQRAHDKDINSVAVSPNDKFFVTGSQDKTAKVRTPRFFQRPFTLVGDSSRHSSGRRQT